MLKNLVLVVKAKQDFVRYTGDYKNKFAPALNSLFESISETYIPLLNMLEKLENDGVPCRIGLVLPPILCSMLSDEEIQNQYIEYLDRQLLLGEEELKRCAAESKKINIITEKKSQIINQKNDFIEKYNKNLISAFAEWMHKGNIELLATSGTDIFMPHYSDMKEVISAQVETGLHAYKQSFGEIPDGFWIPELGYRPGIERIIRAYGFSYTILDSRSVLLSETVPAAGIFYPSRTENSLVVFANDFNTYHEIYSDGGFAENPVYRNENRDIGYELNKDELSTFMQGEGIRYSTGYKYWNKCFDETEYNYEEAVEQVKADAAAFLDKKAKKLQAAEKILSDKDFVTLVCTLDADKMRHNWHEGIMWIEQLYRKASDYDLNITSCNTMIENQYELERISPCYAAAPGAGYGENLLSNKNSWMIRYIRKACERMIDLSDRFSNDTGLKTRLLNLGAKELFVAQSLNLAKDIDENENPEYAESRFKESINAFTAVFDSLGSNTVSTEWLTTLESEDNFFPWMNYRIFSKKR